MLIKSKLLCIDISDFNFVGFAIDISPRIDHVRAQIGVNVVNGKITIS